MAQTMDTYLSFAATQSDLGLSVPQHRLRETGGTGQQLEHHVPTRGHGDSHLPT